MTVYLFKTAVIDTPRLWNSNTIVTDGYHLYFTEYRTAGQLRLRSMRGEDVAIIPIEFGRTSELLYARRINGDLFIFVFHETINTMALYKRGVQIHSLAPRGRRVRNAVRNAKSLTVEYYLNGAQLIQYSITESEIVELAVDIGKMQGSPRIVPENIQVHSTGEYLYVMCAYEIFQHEYATGLQTVMDMDLSCKIHIHGIRFSTNGDYIEIFGDAFNGVVQTFRTILIETSSLNYIQQENIIKPEEYRYMTVDHHKGICNPLSVDKYVMIIRNGSILCEVYCQKTKEYVSVVNDDRNLFKCSYIDTPYKYIDINGGQLYIITDKKIYLYGFKWDIRRVGLQMPTIQRAAITAFWCLREATQKQMPRELIHMIIDRVYEQ